MEKTIRLEQLVAVKVALGLRMSHECRAPASWKMLHLATRAPPPLITFSTSLSVAIEVSPGVVIAKAP